MTMTVEAIYENGKLLLPGPLPLTEKAHVTVTIRTDVHGSDPDRAEWLKLSEEYRTEWLKLSEDSLTKVWDNPGDDVFNELLEK